mgnify:CR=1 FL=1
MEATLRDGLAALGLPSPAAPQLLEFARRLLEKNQVMNLTAITEAKDVATLHLLDCAALLTMADFRGKSVVDVGTGAGFPGLPWKIVREDISLTLLDSLQKRINFLHEVCAKTGIDASLVHARAEDAGRIKAMRETFDIACARAVARLSVLCEYCLPFVKVGGVFAALKGPSASEEVNSALAAVEKLGGKLEKCVEYELPAAQVEGRTLVLIRKIKPTPPIYPRSKTKMDKSPL